MSDPNAGAIQILRKTQPWVRLVGIFGLISSGLIGLLGVVSWIGISTDRVEHVPLATLFVYPVLVVLYLIPSLQLLKYARRISTFVAQGHTAQLESALEAQRAFWRFIGIVVVAWAATMTLALIAAMVIGIMVGV